MYQDVDILVGRLYDVVEAATDGATQLHQLYDLVCEVPPLGRRLCHAAGNRVEREIANPFEAMVLLGQSGVEAEARALLRKWLPTGLLEDGSRPFDVRRPLGLTPAAASDRTHRAAG